MLLSIQELIVRVWKHLLVPIKSHNGCIHDIPVLGTDGATGSRQKETGEPM